MKADLPPRVVLLGASNLTIAFPWIMENLRAAMPDAFEVHAAMGHGRSFGTWSRVLFRGLPGIVECDLWKTLQQIDSSSPDAPTHVLVTDIGNDLLYNASVPQIVEWVRACLSRLARRGVEIVLTLPPLSSVQSLTAGRYLFVRSILFPRNRVTFPQMLELAEDLNAQIETLAREFDAHVVAPPGEWYGFDPIHIRRGLRESAWRQILSGWPSVHLPEESSAASVHASLRYWCAPPAERRLFGVQRAAAQPAITRGQVKVFLY